MRRKVAISGIDLEIVEKASIEQLIACDAAFAGMPDDVYAQIKDFNEHVGGFGHLLFFGQGASSTARTRRRTCARRETGATATAE